MGVHPNWAWSWPANRRVLYNRASCDLEGKPWDPARKQVWWNEAAQKWVGNDVPDFKADSKPNDHMGPFIMNPEGVGRIFGPLACLRGWAVPRTSTSRSKVRSTILLHPKQTHNPVVKRFKTPDDKYGTPKEGYHSRLHDVPPDRALSLLDEEQSDERAAGAGAVRRNCRGNWPTKWALRGGERLKVSSARGEYIAKAMVTKRIKPMMIDGKKIYQIGIPIHWGYPRHRRRRRQDCENPDQSA